MNIFNPINSKMEFVGKCLLETVRYTKDQIQNLGPDSTDAIRLSYFQKPSCFSDISNIDISPQRNLPLMKNQKNLFSIIFVRSWIFQK